MQLRACMSPQEAKGDKEARLQGGSRVSSPSKKRKVSMDAGQVEQIVRRPGALYDYLAACAHDGLWVMDEEGRIVFVDEVLCQRWDRSKDWFVGRSCLDMARAGERDVVKGKLATAVLGERIPALELVHDTSRGESIRLEVNVTCLRDGERVVGLLAVCRDVTERKRAEEELEVYRNNLMALVEKRTQELLVANEQLQREIGEHRKTEEALRTSEEYYRAIFQNTGTAMVIMEEEDTTIALVNRGERQVRGVYAGTARRHEEGHRVRGSLRLSEWCPSTTK